jgi:hypothetical protein
MPADSKGRFHLNTQRAHAADRLPLAAARRPPGMEPGMMEGKDSVSKTTLHDHGDGTFSTEHEDGHREEHPHIGHALVSMGAKHAGGEHTHIHRGDGGELVSHRAGEDGEAEGPHAHQNLDALKDSLNHYFDEEAQERY